EGCDDGGNVAGDGCDASCQPEEDWTCSGASPSVCDKLVDLRVVSMAFAEDAIYQGESAHLAIEIANDSSHAVASGRIELTAPAAGALGGASFAMADGSCGPVSGKPGAVACTFALAAGQSVTLNGSYTPP